jgi:pantothenate kinase
MVWCSACAGAPGSGKSTVCDALLRAVPRAAVLPMDGFHLPRSQLDTFPDPGEAHRRRGAHWTFDAQRFVSCLEAARTLGSGLFPAFDHSVGDPEEDAIRLTGEEDVVIVEGLYLLLDIEPWCRIKDIVDFTFFLDCPQAQLTDRLVKRHMKTLGLSEEQARDRAVNSDLINAMEVINSKGNANSVLTTC